MKNLSHYLLFCFVLWINNIQAQSNSDTSIFFEKTVQNLVRFYFDENYYLVDKFCEFKKIERVAGFDVKTNKFHGLVKDFGPNGYLILEGNYNNGKKDGLFTAYHINGAVKWTVQFINDNPIGDWKYYYPDGNPMLFLTYATDNFSINDFWDNKKKQLIKNGEGKYSLKSPIIGFTEHGYQHYTYRGNVKKGKPHGIWEIYFMEKNHLEDRLLYKSELFDNGILGNDEIEDAFYSLYIDSNEFSMFPKHIFPRAEMLMSKKCSFDTHIGFNGFIANKFNYILDLTPDFFKEDTEIKVKYNVVVSATGRPKKTTILESPFDEKDISFKRLKQLLNQIFYYPPSYFNDSAIEDTLEINLKISKYGDQTIVPPVEITRLKGT